MKGAAILSRSFASVTLAISMLGMLVSGILSFALPYSQTLAGIHTWFGVLFTVSLVLHLRNNLKALVNYLRQSMGKTYLSVAVLTSLCTAVGVSMDLPPFSGLLDFGAKLRKVPGMEAGRFQTIITRPDAAGAQINIDVRAGSFYESEPQPLFLGLSYRSTPQMVFWLEDSEGQYIETLYVTAKVASSNFRSTDLQDSTLRRRPESLPYWSHKRGITDSDGLLVPMENTADLDGLSGATPTGHFDINSRGSAPLRKFRILMEINRSYDFNAFYSKDRFPDDPIYSGSGSSGQPSVIYAVNVDLDSSNIDKHHALMSPIGHGHHSGQDGRLYPDLAKLDTALELVERVLVSIGE